MTITAARHGGSLVAKLTSQMIFSTTKARSAGLSTRLFHCPTTTTSRVLYPSSALALCKQDVSVRLYSGSPSGPEMLHTPSDFDRRILVWSKTYPSLGDIPQTVPHGKMKRAKDLFRIRVNIWMGVWTLIGCIIMIYWGRKSAREGNSIEKENLLWHEQNKQRAQAGKS